MYWQIIYASEANMATVEITWHWIQWRDGDQWARSILPQLTEVGLDEEMLRRSVYVIRLNPPYAIRYCEGTTGISPVLYIGEGDFKTRISSHLRDWIPDLAEVVQACGLQIGVALPRKKGNGHIIHKETEAALLNQFWNLYRNAPLRNKQWEYTGDAHEYDPGELQIALRIGRGMRYQWALEPMAANKFFDDYHRTAEK